MTAASYFQAQGAQRHLDGPRLRGDGLGPGLARDHSGHAAVERRWGACRSTSSPRIPRRPGVVGGLLNSIVGSVIMTGIGLALGAPIGILAGTYLAEYGQAFEARLGRALHQRHFAERALDHRRPVRLRVVGGAGRAFLRACGRCRARGAGRADHGPHDRRHAEPCAEHAARGRRPRSACRVRSSSGTSPTGPSCPG